MKLSCVLISFAFVFVWADITTYMRAVSITNKHIQLAFENNVGSRGNGLEYVIKRIVNGNGFSMDEMNFMIAVPEKASLTNVSGSIECQRFMRVEITSALSIPMPDAAYQNFRNSNLTELGKARRRYTREALRKIILKILASKEPVFSLGQIHRFGKLCCFIGLWMSTKIPSLYITGIKTENNGVCVLMDGSDHLTKYRSFNGVLWQVDAVDIDNKIIELKAQLLEEQYSHYLD
ncbi:uncharacterized protein LOC126847845 isoform X1 [Adelges cooleyi]|uniref:uncharacterized protein LOC126847845 isoform X1 n=1 Tax=Adelges cooleyi TaxID=133065 RepID=UPI00217FE791|nr:uncharacterized protein LOC126847845 isoform X1 [Adelges cooleyi]